MNSAQPWMKFYPSDWRADQALRVCSLAARGLWIECLCIMHEAIPYGHLTINGRPATDAQLASLTGTDPSTVRQLLTELEEAGVSSRNRNGVIYSRRMTRDEKRRKDGRKAVEIGGKVPGSRRHQAAEKKQKNQPPPGVQDGVASKPPMHPEARSQKDTVEAGASTSADNAAPRQSHDLKSEIFGTCLRWLATATGKPEVKLRPAIGRLCSQYGDGPTLETLEACARAGPVDPLGWIHARLNGKATHHGNRTHHGDKRTYGSDGETGKLAILDALGPELGLDAGRAASG